MAIIAQRRTGSRQCRELRDLQTTDINFNRSAGYQPGPIASVRIVTSGTVTFPGRCVYKCPVDIQITVIVARRAQVAAASSQQMRIAAVMRRMARTAVISRWSVRYSHLESLAYIDVAGYAHLRAAFDKMCRLTEVRQVTVAAISRKIRLVSG